MRARATPLWRLENPSISGLRAGLVALPSSVCVPAGKGGNAARQHVALAAAPLEAPRLGACEDRPPVADAAGRGGKSK